MSSDGLPDWYYSALEEPETMTALQQTVFRHLENDNTATLEEIMSVNDIALIFENEVEEFIEEWAE